MVPNPRCVVDGTEPESSRFLGILKQRKAGAKTSGPAGIMGSALEDVVADGKYGVVEVNAVQQLKR